MPSAVPVQPPGQPQSKAAPIAQLTVAPVVGADEEVALKAARFPEILKPRPSRPARPPNTNEPTPSNATIALIQRILVPDRQVVDEQPQSASIEGILPPLTSSNDLDVELYAILAIIIKDFVNTWYTKITPDHGFVEEVIQIIAHCSRALEQRLRQIDIAALLLDEIPALVEAHVDAYRSAKLRAATSPYNLSIRQIYHDLNPHPALAPLPSDEHTLNIQYQQENEAAYRHLLVQGSLAVLLPTEDLQNDPLRVLVGDILADLIVGQTLAGKVCEGWFLHNAISTVTAIVSDKVQPKVTGDEIHDDAKNRLEKYGLLSSDSEFQKPHSSVTDQSRAVACFWRFMQYGYLAYLFLQYVLVELQNIRQRPKWQYHARTSTSSLPLSEKGRLQNPRNDDRPSRPVLAFAVFGMISTTWKVAERVPWVASMLLFWQHALLLGSGQMGGLNSILDRFLYHAIGTHVLPPSLLPVILRNLRAALFPNNTVGPPAPPPPSYEETREIKRKAAASIRALTPSFVAHTYYATNNEEEILTEIEEDMLEPLDDVYLNKHLVYAILELILVRLMPELAEQSVKDLLVERGVH